MRAKLTSHSSIPAVIQDLTLEEKANLLAAWTACHSYAIPDMDIPAIVLADGATGVNGSQMMMDYYFSREHGEEGMSAISRHPELFSIAGEDLDAAREKYRDDPSIQGLIDHIAKTRPGGRSYISFPSGINIGAAFSPDTASKIGEAVGWELRDSGIDICLGPNVDVARDPLGGRNYEMYGEDPELVAQTGAAFIQGLQSTGVGGCAKHYIANNQETNRNAKNEHISERTLREIYARGFKAAVQKGGVKSVMSAYNAVNGVFSSYNKMLLTDWLREEWGFTGLVVSDWGAVTERKAESLEAGMDLILCGPKDMTEVVQAVQDGTLPEEVLNQRVAKVLETILWAREVQAATPARYDAEELLETATATVADGAVLLKNKGDLLPLNPGAKVAFYGRRSRELLEYGSGSTAVPTMIHTNPYDEVKARYSPDAAFEVMDGVDTVIYTVTAPAGENVDRESMEIEEADRKRLPEVLRAAKEKGLHTVVLLNISGPVEMEDWLSYADSVLSIFIPGCMGGRAAADLLFGAREPGGRLPVSMPVRYEDTPCYPNFPGEYTDAYYGEGVFIGYRSYEKRKLPVQFPFGFGLGYTTFSIKPACESVSFDTAASETVSVPVTVTNTGLRPGSAVVQVYYSEDRPRVLRPVKELGGFAKVWLNPGEQKTVEVAVNRETLHCFDPKLKRWVLPVGDYTLSIGSSSAEIVGTVPMKVLGPKVYVMGADSTVSEILRDQRAVEIIDRYTGGMLAAAGEDNLKMMAEQKIGAFLSQRMIAKIPDTVALDQLMQKMMAELAELA